jgi:hypothetical protein
MRAHGSSNFNDSPTLILILTNLQDESTKGRLQIPVQIFGRRCMSVCLGVKGIIPVGTGRSMGGSDLHWTVLPSNGTFCPN